MIVSYSADNDAKFKRLLSEASAAVEDLRIPFGLISMDFYKSQKAIFSLKGPGQYPDFKKDPKTGESKYKKWKLEKFGFDYPLLFRTGALGKSVMEPTAPGSIHKITKLSLTIGTAVDYGVYHQSDDPRNKIPLRKFLFIGPEAQRFATSEQMGRLERWMGILNDYVIKRLQREL